MNVHYDVCVAGWKGSWHATVVRVTSVPDSRYPRRDVLFVQELAFTEAPTEYEAACVVSEILNEIVRRG